MPGYVLKNPNGSFEERAAKVAALVDEINGTWTGATADAVGKLSMVAPSYDNAPLLWPTLQSEELPWLDGARIIESLAANPWSRLDAGMAIGSLERSTALIKARLNEMCEALRVARATVAEAIGRAPFLGRPAPPVSFGISPDAHGYTTEVVATIGLLGDDLTLHAKSVSGELHRDVADEISREIADALALHEARAAKLRCWNERRIRGVAETTVQRILAAAGMPLDFALERLRLMNWLEFEFDDGRQSARLEWSEGLLKADFEDDAAQVFLSDGQLEFPPIPNSLVYGLPGRRVGELLTQAYIDPAIRILQASMDDRRTILKLEMTCEQLMVKDGSAD